jgi:hypothetical protein
VNNSFSGATICHTGYRSEDYSDHSFITRMKALGCPDIIFIFGATNDYWAKSPLGEYQYADWSKKDLYSFRPAMSYMLDTMIDYYPNVEIYFLLNDGNGRMGRLWQSLILGRLHPLFEYLPVENMVYANQEAYYNAIQHSTATADSGPFIEFMLQEILKSQDS